MSLHVTRPSSSVFTYDTGTVQILEAAKVHRRGYGIVTPATEFDLYGAEVLLRAGLTYDTPL